MLCIWAFHNMLSLYTLVSSCSTCYQLFQPQDEFTEDKHNHGWTLVSDSLGCQVSSTLHEILCKHTERISDPFQSIDLFAWETHRLHTPGDLDSSSGACSSSCHRPCTSEGSGRTRTARKRHFHWRKLYSLCTLLGYVGLLLWHSVTLFCDLMVEVSSAKSCKI